MQPYTQELRKMEDEADALEALKKEGFVQLPDCLQEDAAAELEDLTSKFVTREQASGRNLLAWAKNERNKRKRARKAQRKARKGNRAKKA
jgi:hypothetical protein